MKRDRLNDITRAATGNVMSSAHLDLNSSGLPSGRRGTRAPRKSERLALVNGPYKVPNVDVGFEITCLLRGRAKVCGWGSGKIRWPLIRVGHGGKGAYVMTPELARAVRLECQARELLKVAKSRPAK